MPPVPPQPIPFAARDEVVSFDRHELGAILSVYGRMVAAGEWRDYGFAAMRDVAVFSIFRRSGEVPLYRIEKRPKLRAKQGAFAVLSEGGQVLRRGHDLAAVLRFFDRKLIKPIE